MIENKKINYLLPLLIAVSVIVGMWVEKTLSRNQSTDSLFVYPQTNKINTIINYIVEEYVDSVSKDDLIEKTIPEVLTNLDPHSVYIPAEALQHVNEPLEGNFDGIGVQFNIQKDTIIVVKVIAGGPSQLVGIIDGDRIVEINENVVAGIEISTDSVMKLLRGDRGTKVDVGIVRKNVNEILDFTITRGKIPLYSVDVAYMANDTTGFIKISKFAKTTADEFIDAVKKLQDYNLKNLIIDLRGNSGGYMDAATRIADEFLPRNTLIVYTQGRSRPKSMTYASSRNLCVDYNVVILQDEFSASASEILAGAIQDNDRGIIIGRRSYGKGLVQEPTMFTDGSAIRLTTARYYTPTGRSIQKPYVDGKDEKYFNDLGTRYMHGEFMQEDSIQFDDSLKYKTPGGKTVYGGGGIMPDIFVSFDTTGNSNYFSRISRRGLEYQFAFAYADNNRKVLTEYKNISELNSHLKSNINKIYNDFIIYADENGVKRNNKDLEISGSLIKVRLRALIARNIFDNDGFYPIIREVDKTLYVALESFKEQ
jgi:carboxyl-terminal processing protease